MSEGQLRLFMKGKDPTVVLDADDEDDAHALHASPMEEPVDKTSEEPKTLDSEESISLHPEEPYDKDAAALVKA
eukprot:6490747-Amphidinium_carterae.2